MRTLGIDIGGSAIKMSIVDTDAGSLLGERLKIATPEVSSPQKILAAIREAVDSLNNPQEPIQAIGIGFPSVVALGMALGHGNLHPDWKGVDLDRFFSEGLGISCHCTNDADAAALAESTFGAGKGEKGVVVVLTFGTGIGSGLLVNGKLVPNTEFGQVWLKKKKTAEHYLSDRARRKRELSLEEWAKKTNAYLQYLCELLYPQLIIIGGGISKKYEEYKEQFKLPCRIKAAKLENDAGIVGAALFSKANCSVNT